MESEPSRHIPLDAHHSSVAGRAKFPALASSRLGQGKVAGTITPDVAVRGGAINNDRSWQFTLILRGWYCEGACLLEDQLTQRVTTDPGALIDRVNVVASYSPNNTDGLKDVYNVLRAFCNSDFSFDCGSEQFPPGIPGTRSGSNTYTLGHEDVHGSWVSTQTAYWATYVPSGQTLDDKARTAQAFCPVGTNACTY